MPWRIKIKTPHAPELYTVYREIFAVENIRGFRVFAAIRENIIHEK